MSEILLRWLNDEVHLCNPVTDFETDCSNGYAFGELLDKHEMQPDFHLFIDGDHPDAKTNKFVLVEPTLRTLGVKFNSRSASQIMVGQPGAAQKLLYQVMVAVRGFECNVLGTTRRPSPSRWAATRWRRCRPTRRSRTSTTRRCTISSSSACASSRRTRTTS